VTTILSPGLGAAVVSRKAAAEAEFRARVEQAGGVVLIRCKNGHGSSPLPGNLRKGQGLCRECSLLPGTRLGHRKDSIAAEAAFRARLADLGAALLEPYSGARVRHHVRCAGGHDCWVTPTNAAKPGRGICRVCARLDPACAETAFRAQMAELGATLLGPYVNTATRVWAQCAAGHECWPLPNFVQQGGGICRTCAGKDPAAAEAEFRKRVAELGGEVLEPAYLGVDKPHQCRCPEGHICYPRPAGLKRFGMCFTCTGNDPVRAEARFRARLAELGAELLQNYVNAVTPHRCRCQQGHICWPTPAHLQCGRGPCHICAYKIPSTVFYVVAAEDRRIVKFGVSWGTGTNRLQAHRRDGYRTVIRLLTDLPPHLPMLMEDDVRATLRLAGFKPVQGREYFDADALALILDVVDNYPATMPLPEAC
jgi:hypothetical protein